MHVDLGQLAERLFAALAVNLAACVVVSVDDAGLITSLDEYVDGSNVPTAR